MTKEFVMIPLGARCRGRLYQGWYVPCYDQPRVLRDGHFYCPQHDPVLLERLRVQREYVRDHPIVWESAAMEVLLDGPLTNRQIAKLLKRSATTIAQRRWAQLQRRQRRAERAIGDVRAVVAQLCSDPRLWATVRLEATAKLEAFGAVYAQRGVWREREATDDERYLECSVYTLEDERAGTPVRILEYVSDEEDTPPYFPGATPWDKGST